MQAKFGTDVRYMYQELLSDLDSATLLGDAKLPTASVE